MEVKEKIMRDIEKYGCAVLAIFFDLTNPYKPFNLVAITGFSAAWRLFDPEEEPSQESCGVRVDYVPISAASDTAISPNCEAVGLVIGNTLVESRSKDSKADDITAMYVQGIFEGWLAAIKALKGDM